jgi:DNA repair protein RadC
MNRNNFGLAHAERQMRVVDHNPDARIKALSAELAELLKTKFEGRCIISSWALLLDYLKAQLVPLALEQVRVLYLDTKNRLIADEVHSKGTIDECPLHIREIIHRALNLGATAMILAHNHPSGDPSPSIQDIRFTLDLVDAGKHLKLKIHDHVIVGGTADPVSMRAKGLLP